MATIGFISLGCAKNQVDCERMMYRVQEAGHRGSGDIPGSDVVVINTCGFIDSAKSEAIDYILQTAALKAEGRSTTEILGLLSESAQADGKTLKDLFGSVEGGSAAIAGGVRYLLVVLFAGCVWPLTFWWFGRLGRR